jgi:CMP-N-acetylneuraminic acid synthetase
LLKQAEALTTKQELHRAIDKLTDAQLQKVIRALEVIQAEPARVYHDVNLARYSGILYLNDDPVTYQRDMRNEWS